MNSLHSDATSKGFTGLGLSTTSSNIYILKILISYNNKILMLTLFAILQVREIHDRSKPNCFELFATGGADIIKACKTDSEGKVCLVSSVWGFYFQYFIYFAFFFCRLLKVNIPSIVCLRQPKKNNRNG